MAYNVIAVHWTPLATWDNYFVAAKNAVRVGQYSGQTVGLYMLIHGLGQTPDQIHAIGHSLGAHLVGHFARTIKNDVGPISRVTGNYLILFPLKFLLSINLKSEAEILLQKVILACNL